MSVVEQQLIPVTLLLTTGGESVSDLSAIVHIATNYAQVIISRKKEQSLKPLQQ